MFNIETKEELLALVLRAIPETAGQLESKNVIDPDTGTLDFWWGGIAYCIDMDLNVVSEDKAHQTEIEALLEVLIRQRTVVEALLGKERESTVF